MTSISPRGHDPAERLRPHAYRDMVSISELSKVFPQVDPNDACGEYSQTHRTRIHVWVEELCAKLRCDWGYDETRGRGRVYLYHTDDVYAMGYVAIGYKQGVTKYIVQSRTIRNERYGTGNYQYNVVSTKLSPQAMKNAKRYLTPITPQEMFVISYDRYEHSKRSVKYVIGQKINDRLDKLGVGTNAIGMVGGTNASGMAAANKCIALEELIALNERGHDFLDPNTPVEINAIAEEMKDYRQLHGGEEDVFYCIKGDVVYSLAGGDVYNMYPTYKVDRHTWGELSEEVQGKLSSLSILEDSGYVVGLGCVGVANSVFYVSP